MTRSATARLRGSVLLAVVGLAAALASGRPELAALAGPFAVLVVVGLALDRPPRLEVSVALDRDRALEGEAVSVALEVRATAPGERLVEVELVLPEGLAALAAADDGPGATTGAFPGGPAYPAVADERPGAAVAEVFPDGPARRAAADDGRGGPQGGVSPAGPWGPGVPPAGDLAAGRAEATAPDPAPPAAPADAGHGGATSPGPVRLGAPAGGAGLGALVRVAPGRPAALAGAVRCTRWGAYRPGPVVVRATDAFGLVRYEARVAVRVPLRVYPRPEVLRASVRPAETAALAGDQLARVRGQGVEFADLRPYAAGDPARTVNWRASARRGGLWVSARHPERNADVVLLLDLHGGVGALDRAVRAAAALADAYTAGRDRVGLVTFGGRLRWVEPGGGLAQRYRIVEALLDSELARSEALADAAAVPAGTLPPKALVVAVTALAGPGTVAALVDLRRRGFDVAALEVAPAGAATSPSSPLARRLRRLEAEASRSRLRRLGVAVAEWRPGEPVEAAVEGVGAFRRAARLARA